MKRLVTITVVTVVLSIMPIRFATEFVCDGREKAINGQIEKTFWLPASATIFTSHTAWVSSITNLDGKILIRDVRFDKYQKLKGGQHSVLVGSNSVEYRNEQGSILVETIALLDSQLAVGASVKKFEYLGGNNVRWEVEQTKGDIVAAIGSGIICGALVDLLFFLVLVVLWIMWMATLHEPTKWVLGQIRIKPQTSG